ncbi:MAG: phasin [Tardiphaga sp.]|nr:phasin [Tardiphaga sp.]
MADTTDPFSSSVIPFQVPEQVRELAEKGVLQARAGYAKFKDAAEAHNGTVQAVVTSATRGATDFSAKLLEIVKTNTNAGFDFAQELVAAKSPSAAVELWTAFTRKQVKTFTGQTKELAELTQKIVTESAEPIKNGTAKLFQPAA